MATEIHIHQTNRIPVVGTTTARSSNDMVVINGCSVMFLDDSVVGEKRAASIGSYHDVLKGTKQTDKRFVQFDRVFIHQTSGSWTANVTSGTGSFYGIAYEAATTGATEGTLIFGYEGIA